MTKIEMQLFGVDETISKLRTFPEKVQRRALAKAATAGGTAMVREIRSRVPQRSGMLKRTIDKKVKRYKTAAVAVVGQNKRKAPPKKFKGGGGGISGTGKAVPIHLVEQRVGPHAIPRRGLRDGARGMPVGDGVVRQRAQHPGHPGRSMVAEASRAGASAAIGAMEQKLAEEVEAIASSG